MKYTFEEAIRKPVWSKNRELKSIKKFLTEMHNISDIYVYMEWIEYLPIGNNKPFDRLGLKVDFSVDEYELTDKMYISDLFDNLIYELSSIEYSVTISALGKRMEFSCSEEFRNVESYWTILYAGNNPNAFQGVKVNEMVLEVDIDTNTKKKQSLLSTVPKEILDNESNLLDLCGYTETIDWV